MTQERKTPSRPILGCAGFILGGVTGLCVGSVAGFPLGELMGASHEAQAYLMVLIAPMIALLGAVTGAAALASIPPKRGPYLMIAGLGSLILGGLMVLGTIWSVPAKSAGVRVRNATNVDFTNLYLGADYRRNQRIGQLEAGETSARFNVDLANPATFRGLEGKANDEYVRHQLPLGECEDLPEGDYLWVVRGEPGALEYSFRRDD
jgi:hypothetical protein